MLQNSNRSVFKTTRQFVEEKMSDDEQQDNFDLYDEDAGEVVTFEDDGDMTDKMGSKTKKPKYGSFKTMGKR